ncbi:MAG TPA: hypothetical protein VG889_01635 [Rhizomicrobium sp.]|nr:hypothetical protein [Rhizomicrobium sp.]
MPAGLVVAIGLHAAIIAATFFTWSHRLDIADQAPVVPVDLVTLGDKTNVRATVKEEAKAPPKEEVVQPPEPQQAQVTPSAPAQEEDQAPPPPDETAQEKIKPTPPPPVVPQQKPQPEKKKETFDIDKMMALLDKRAPAASSAPNAKPDKRTIKGIGDQSAMTADLNALLGSMMYKCWSPPIGAPNAAQLIVIFRVFLKEDGTVGQPPELVRSPGNDSYSRAAVEAARRAIYTCQPYSLPHERYAQWSDANVTFDPRAVVGQ